MSKPEKIKKAERAQHKLKKLPKFGDKKLRHKIQAAYVRYSRLIAGWQPVERKRPKVVYKRISPNRSSRSGVTPRLIVIHDTESPEREGKGDLVAIADYFANPAVQASSHVITDGDGLSARCVKDSEKAWHAAYYNSASLGIEQIGYASRSKAEWPDAQIKETARWVAKWSKAYEIPIRHVDPGSRGVVTHADLGSQGGGHWDPGPGYPLAKMLRYAKEFS